MPEKRTQYTAEFRDEAVKMVIESGRAIADVAREIHVNDGTLGNWVNKYRKEHPVEDEPLTVSERARLRELEKEKLDVKETTKLGLGWWCLVGRQRVGEHPNAVPRRDREAEFDEVPGDVLPGVGCGLDAEFVDVGPRTQGLDDGLPLPANGWPVGQRGAVCGR